VNGETLALEIMLFIVGQVVVAAAIWGGIRADIKAMHVRLSALEERFNAHVDGNVSSHGWKHGGFIGK